MNALLLDFLYGVGIAYGLLWVAAIFVAWEAIFEPLIEWTLERYERGFVPAEYPPPTEEPIGAIVLISDLHIDTWDRAVGGRANREAEFLTFLQAIARNTMELYINGDLFDTPPNPEDTWHGNGFDLTGSVLPKYENVLGAICDLNNMRPLPVLVTLLYGNHDMGTSGLRYDLVRRPDLVTRFRVPFNTAWYPNLVIGVPHAPGNEGQETFRFYVDHGHFYDPVLFLYLRDFVVAVLRRDLRRAMTTLVLSVQRRSSEQQAIPRPGIAPSRQETRDQRIAHWLVRYRWRWKARRVLIERSRQETHLGNRPLAGALFGHTHLPDSYTYRTGAARGMTYVNTGDWMGDTGHGTYTVLRQEGVVVQYDWLDRQKRAPYH